MILASTPTPLVESVSLVLATATSASVLVLVCFAMKDSKLQISSAFLPRVASQLGVLPECMHAILSSRHL